METLLWSLPVLAAAGAFLFWRSRVRPRAKLTLREGSGPGLEFPIARKQVTIGSEEGRTVVVSHPRISGLHATLSREDGHYVLRDRSKRGTKVNGESVEEKELRSGDLIRLADKIDLIFTRLD